MSSSPPRPPPRPSRAPRPSFFLDTDDGDDDFFQAPRINADDPARAVTPFPDETNPALVPGPSLSPSESSHPDQSPPNAFADPASSTVAVASASSHSPDSEPFRNSIRSSYPPLLSPIGIPSPHPSPFLFRTKPTGPPPSAFVERRADSPGSTSNGHYSSDDGFVPAPAPPFARPNHVLSEASRTSSAHSFAPPPLPWMRDSLHTSLSSTGTDLAAGRQTPIKRKAFTSQLLTGTVPKPWLDLPDRWATYAKWITRVLFLVGVAAAAAICYFGVASVELLGNVCLLMEDNFDTLDTNTWQREVEVGGLNGDFQWYTASDNNSFVDSGHLYIVPSPTSLAIGEQAVFDGYKLTLKDCTTTNKTACSAASSNSAGTVINPVQSARLTTRLSYNLKYGRVEVRAKMPQGDWLWPAIWMLPVNETYGPWPMSGEIDIAEARGNGLSYPAQGSNYISSTLNWGPTKTINAWTKTWGWITQRRTSYSAGFHTYAVEWTEDFMRFYVDSRVQSTLSLSFRKKSLFDLGDFPPIIQNGAQETVLQNPWAGRGNNAPFDQPFYLILNVAAGGTNGWFPDNVGGKPWVDQTASAMRDFAFHQSDWYATWPENVKERAMVVDSVKMWTRC